MSQDQIHPRSVIGDSASIERALTSPETSPHLIGAKILIVDDQPANRDLLIKALEPEGYKILSAPSGEVALKIAARALPDLILLDILMPGLDGFAVCRQLKNHPSTREIPLLFVTAKDETKDVVEGFRLGGVDYITKPFEKEEVLVRVKTHLKISCLTKELQENNTKLQKANERLHQEIEKRKQANVARQQAEEALKTADEHLSLISQQEAQRWGIAGLIGQSRTMQKTLEQIRRLHQTGTTTVLITGESGTGKELIARAIHFGGPRAKGPFIAVNCSAIPKELAESIFFGNVRGAFTGANTDRKGHFELAHNGTLFLDEIGDMSLELQAKLLRVLEDGCFTPVGGTREKHVDVRVLAATNVDLPTKIGAGGFREDLYYRLARFVIPTPPLRERPEDIPPLADHFLKLFATEMGKPKSTLSQEALAALRSYPFPGNVRELKNIIERALIESGGVEIRPEHLYFTHPYMATPALTPPSDSVGAKPALSLPLNLGQAESLLIQRALEQANGNASEAARLLGISRATLYRKLEQQNISCPVPPSIPFL